MIPIGEARTLSRKYACPVVVIFAIEPDTSRFTVTTYGATKKLCRHAASLGEQFSCAVMNEEVAPVSIEPFYLPDDPAVLAPRESR